MEETLDRGERGVHAVLRQRARAAKSSASSSTTPTTSLSTAAPVKPKASASPSTTQAQVKIKAAPTTSPTTALDDYDLAGWTWPSTLPSKTLPCVTTPAEDCTVARLHAAAEARSIPTRNNVGSRTIGSTFPGITTSSRMRRASGN